MKNFLKIFISIFISLLIIFLITLSLIIGIVVNTSQSPVYKNQEILVLDFSKGLVEYLPIQMINSLINVDQPPTIQECLTLIERAATDDRIKGIFINGKSNLDINHALSIQDALKSFKESGKFVEAYGEYFTQNAYIMASAADKIILNPNGFVSYKGMALVNMYYKDFLEKYGINPIINVAGEYKSAVESFTRNEASPENIEQYTELIDDISLEMNKTIAYNRNIQLTEVQKIQHQYLGRNATSAQASNLVDELSYKTDYLQTLTSSINNTEKEAFISLQEYSKFVEFPTTSKNANIAILYAEGNIVSSSNVPGGIIESNYRKAFSDIRKNKSIKGILLRINSPGGSATASDELWNEVMLCKKANIPVVVSMGSAAASGGYYMAAPADYIFAESTTLTGSIGVYSMFFEVSEALEKNFSIHTDEISNTPFAAGMNGLVSLSEEQKQIMQNQTERLYLQFKSRVAEGRNMSMERVEEIAKGHVYAAKKAQELGLVDYIGDQKIALAFLRNEFDLADSGVSVYPKPKQDLKAELRQLISKQIPLMHSSTNVKIEKTYNSINEILSGSDVYMRMPYIEIR